MLKGISWLVLLLGMVMAANFAWKHYHPSTQSADAVSAPENPQYAEQKEAQQVVGVSGPLADYFKKKPTEAQQAETTHSSTRARDASEHVEDSPVGTGNTILHKTFGIAKTVDVPFEVPAHAASPRLHGAFHSYVQVGATKSADPTADVDFLLLNEEQHADLLSGRDSEAVFSAADAHDQEVNFNMPSTFNKPAKYFLVFRNSSAAQGKKVVQADFRIDF